MQPRVLIVDNEPHICESLRDRLESSGYETLVTHDGPTALALAALESVRGPIAGALLDLQMPVMSGMEVLDALRARHPHIRIVMMSAGGDRQLLEEAVRRGASAYVLKPFDTTELMRLCDRLFRGGLAASV